ncbi:MAG: leucine-rich repeat protein, partial [Oscillospiraceae bacterium]|nr:leucine-rich repeat protein [Oscillospiraceae bacterium]
MKQRKRIMSLLMVLVMLLSLLPMTALADEWEDDSADPVIEDTLAPSEEDPAPSEDDPAPQPAEGEEPAPAEDPAPMLDEPAGEDPTEPAADPAPTQEPGESQDPAQDEPGSDPAPQPMDGPLPREPAPLQPGPDAEPSAMKPGETAGTNEVISEEWGSNITWSLDTVTGVLTISGSGAMKDGKLSGGGITTELKKNIKTIVIEQGVTSVGERNFEGFSGVTSLSFPGSLTSIGDHAFDGVFSLSFLTIPSNIQSIGDYAFWGSALRNVTIPDSVTSLGEGAFCNSDYLTSVTIGTGVTKINPSTFCGCDRLVNVSIPNTVTEIGSKAFSDCYNLQSISIPNSVTTIGEEAFANSGLQSITIPSSVASVGNKVFYFCKSLNTVILYSGLTLSYNAFQDSGIKCIVFRSGPPVFEMYMGSQLQFSGVHATALYPAGNSAWTADIQQNYGGDITWKSYDYFGACGDHVYWSLLPGGELFLFGSGEMWSDTTPDFRQYRGSITSVTISDGVTKLKNWAFQSFSVLQNVTMGDDVINIGEGAFYNCPLLTNVSFGRSKLMKIEKNAFKLCTSLADMVLPDTLDIIGESAFYGCESLTAVTIPSGLNSIEDKAFANCTALKSFSVPYSVWFTTSDGVLYNRSMTELIQYPPAKTYTSYWIVPKVTVVAPGAFSGSRFLEEIHFQSDAPSIGEDAFYGVTATVYYPGANESWTDSVRQNYGGTIHWAATGTASGTCGDDVSWSFDADIKSLTISGSGAIAENPSYLAHSQEIRTVVIRNGVTEIGKEAFKACTALTSISLPA